MEKFKDVFNNWIIKRYNSKIEIIDKICSELDIDSDKWFSYYLIHNAGDYAGMGLLEEMLSNFIFYISREFEKQLIKFITPKGYNVYKEPYFDIDLNLKYDINSGFHVRKKNKFRKLIKTITKEQRLELMKDKLFSYIVNQTNLKIFSKKEIRFLKLKAINEYSANNSI